MNMIKKLWSVARRHCGLACMMLMGLLASGHFARATGETDVSDVTTALTDLTTLFATVATLAILVTGFFIGRRWLKRV